MKPLQEKMVEYRKQLEKGIDSVLEHILVADPDFGRLDALTKQIDQGALNFIQAVENYLSSHL